MKLAILAALLAVMPSVSEAECVPLGQYRITGYTRNCCTPWTADGTSIWTPEHIVAASPNLPFNTRIRISGLDYTYRVADRMCEVGKCKGVEARHIDVAVDTVAEANAIETWVGGRYAEVCLVTEGE